MPRDGRLRAAVVFSAIDLVHTAGMRGSQNVFLIGPMGSGKTAVGRQLAKQLKLTFHDSDAQIEQRTGVDIPLIFEKEGEPRFREREREVIDDLTRLDGIVLSTGGGAVLAADSRERLAARGFVVYLETSVEQQAERVRSGQHRPLLAGVDPAVKLAELMAQREPLYRSIADLVVRTDGRKVGAVADEILRAYRHSV
jgi:shikimate kinase